MANVPSLEGLSAEDITRLASVSQALLTNPKTRGDAQRLVKKIDEQAVFPEMDLDDRLQAMDRQHKEEWARRDKADAERKAIEERQRTLESLERRGILTSDEVKIDPESKLAAVEKYMVTNKITDYESAARLYRMEQSPAGVTSDPFYPQAPTAPTLPTIDMAGKNLNQWSKEEAYRTWGDLKSGKVKFNEQGAPIK